jgi:ABC-type transport system substrate-binding protein
MPPKQHPMKKYRYLLLIPIVLVAVFCIQSCRQQPPPNPKSLTVGLETDITSLDPIKTLDPHVSRVVGQVFEGLVGLDENNQVIPLLAESWKPNENFDEWRFILRKGVYFHESDLFGPSKTRQLTAEDVAFSFNRIFSKESMIGFVLDGVIKGGADVKAGKTSTLLGVKVISSNEIEIQLETPDPLFVNRLTSVLLAIVPREAGTLAPGEFGVKTTVGTGPFRIDQRTDSEALLSKNSKYWRQTSGNVEKLGFRVIKNDQIRLVELKNKKIDLARIPSALADGVAEKASGAGSGLTLHPDWQDFQFLVFRTFNVVALGFNSDKMDVHLRRAINFGLKRKDIVGLSLPGLTELAVGPIPLGFPGYKPVTTEDIYDPEKARTELKLSKSPILPGPVEILVHEKDGSEQVGQLVQAQLKEIGLETKLTKMDYNAVIGRMISGEFSSFIMAFEFIYSTPGPIVEMNFNPKKIPVPNFWRYNNPAVSAVLEQFKSVKDSADANRLALEIEKLVLEDPPAAFLFQNKMFVVFRNGISNVKFNGHSVPLLWETKVD